MGKGMIRVDRGDGRLLQFQRNDVEAFLKANAGAKRVDTPTVSTAPSPAEVAATNAQGFGGMTVAQLKEHAEKNGIDLEGASVKADIVERIEAASNTSNE
jgi:hypothetical protein